MIIDSATVTRSAEYASGLRTKLINEREEEAWTMSEKSRPRYSFSRRLEGGEFLNVAVWPGKSNPEDEVVTVQLRKFDGNWKTLARLALYRTKDGTYSELPEKARGPEQQEGS